MLIFSGANCVGWVQGHFHGLNTQGLLSSFAT